MPILEKVVTDAGGAVKLCKVNIDDQAIAAQLRVQSVPTVYAFIDGQPVDGFTGRNLNQIFALSWIACSSSRRAQLGLNQLLEMADEAIGLKNFPEAGALFSQAFRKTLKVRGDGGSDQMPYRHGRICCRPQHG